MRRLRYETRLLTSNTFLNFEACSFVFMNIFSQKLWYRLYILVNSTNHHFLWPKGKLQTLIIFIFKFLIFVFLLPNSGDFYAKSLAKPLPGSDLHLMVFGLTPLSTLNSVLLPRISTPVRLLLIPYRHKKNFLMFWLVGKFYNKKCWHIWIFIFCVISSEKYYFKSTIYNYFIRKLILM